MISVRHSRDISPAVSQTASLCHTANKRVLAHRRSFPTIPAPTTATAIVAIENELWCVRAIGQKSMDHSFKPNDQFDRDSHSGDEGDAFTQRSAKRSSHGRGSACGLLSPFYVWPSSRQSPLASGRPGRWATR